MNMKEYARAGELSGWAILFCLAFSFTPSVWAQSTSSFFKTAGQNIVDPSGNPVVLRGVGLGGWLMPEGYMLHISAPDGGSPRTIRSQIEKLIGVDDTDRFYEIYQDNYVEEKDITAIASWGYDHIRLPFHYKVFYDSEKDTFKEEGFTLLNTFLEWCKTYNLYVILDMHATPGAQNALNISDSDGTARLWTEPVPYQDQTVKVWTEIARRYADETLIIGYDLINEPVLPLGISSAVLRAFYVRLTQAIRAIDPNHILFIEGNWFATNFTSLTPPFDNNMVYAFHKYWTGTGQNTIQYLLNIRNQHNVPLWLGESGENSNTWYFEVTRLMEQFGIGWNWWTHKKIETITSPLSAPFSPGYEDVLNYWRGNSPRPSAQKARDALFAMAEGLDLDSCEVRIGVLAALFEPAYATLRQPFKEHKIPGLINAVDYDLGNQGVTYSDRDGGNNGGKYRNDGVDIEISTDLKGFDFNVGWMSDQEWLTYTVNIETEDRYDIEIRVASAQGWGRFRMLLDEEQIGKDLSVVNTGGWQNWISVWLHGVQLPFGAHTLKLLVRTGEFNVNNMRFSKTGIEEKSEIPRDIQLLGNFPNPFKDRVQVQFQSDRAVRGHLKIFDVLGREVYSVPWKNFGAGSHTIHMRPQLVSGMYLYRLELDDGQQKHKFLRKMVVIR